MADPARVDLPPQVLNHPGLRNRYRPNAALVIRNHAGLLLWCERIRYPGCWQFPQGGVDPGETPLEAAWREAGEELGLPDPAASLRLEGQVAEPLRYDFTVPFIEEFLERRGHSYVGQAQHFFLARFLGDERELTLRPPPGCEPEFASWRWAGPELVETVPWFKRTVARDALRALGVLEATDP
ncbi:MAG: RNA pyrophosphohydrolase [Sandaracinus sp.]|nr:RNA pyrophosphohydrolase [Sandaracinus sp.]|tara:strand:- start:166 stop:714 length:549 start_codon:yes stop_codon:yes gene_type:complete